MVSGIALDLPPTASIEDNSPFYSQTSNMDFKDETMDENVWKNINLLLKQHNHRDLRMFSLMHVFILGDFY